MPRDSSWNTAVVSARRTRSKVRASASGSSRTTIGASPAAARSTLMSRTAQSMMVRVRRPRKSNLTRPIASTSPMSKAVTGEVDPCSQYSGMNSDSGRGAITTPPAWRPALRVRPSSWRARSMRVRTSSSCS